MKRLIAAVAAAALSAAQAEAGDEAVGLEGPGRFCGYSPIIDLLPGERITTLQGGIHGGSFRWEGAFGSLLVHGIGWASRPDGRILESQTSTKPARFEERRVDERYEIAIWNGAQGAAYFSSATPFTERQIAAIRRVNLYQEGQKPSGCDLRTSFYWG